MESKVNLFCEAFIARYGDDAINGLVCELTNSAYLTERPVLLSCLERSMNSDTILSNYLCNPNAHSEVCCFLEKIIHDCHRNKLNYFWVKIAGWKFFELFFAKYNFILYEKINVNNDNNINTNTESKVEDVHEYKKEETNKSTVKDMSGQQLTKPKTTWYEFFQSDENVNKIMSVFKTLLFRNEGQNKKEWMSLNKGSDWAVYNVYNLLQAFCGLFKEDCSFLLRILQALQFSLISPGDVVGGTILEMVLISKEKQKWEQLYSWLVKTEDIEVEMLLDCIPEREQITEHISLSQIGIIIKIAKTEVENIKKDNDLSNSNSYKKVLNDLLEQIKPMLNKSCIRTAGIVDEVCLQKCLVLMLTAVDVHTKYQPNAAQCISYCLLMMPLPNNQNEKLKRKGRLLEVKTGEGKSCIIAMVAATYALMGKKVDIVTSSPILAQRDYNSWRSFYELLKLGTMWNENVDAESAIECYNSHIVYGTVNAYARDILRTKFLFHDIGLQKRDRDIVLIDEVDSMLIDQNSQLTYLSHNNVSSGSRHLEPVLAFIWMNVSQYGKLYVNANEQVLYHSPFQSLLTILECSLSNVSGCETIRNKLNSNGSEIYKNPLNCKSADSIFDELEKCSDCVQDICFYKIGNDDLLENRVINDQHNANLKKHAKKILICDNGIAAELISRNDVITDVTNLLKILTKPESEEKALRSVKYQMPAEGRFEIPEFLQDYVRKCIPCWVENAMQAREMTKDREYAILCDKSISPIDYLSTGVTEINKKWSNGLQQFLEMKHLLPLSSMPCITNYLSNITFFNDYTKIIGVSGTLPPQENENEQNNKIKSDNSIIDTNSSNEQNNENNTGNCSTYKPRPTNNSNTRKFLMETYQVDCCAIPTIKTKRFYELESIILENDVEWIEAIIRCIDKEVLQTGRAALVLCEDIQAVYQLKRSGVLFYCQSEDNKHTNFAESEIKPGTVILATNLGSRGTDYIVSSKVNDCGGLLVIVTFLPYNDRVEKQAFGRAARNGQCGSAQLILNRKRLPEMYNNCTHISDMKYIRDCYLTGNDKSNTSITKDEAELFETYCSHIKKFVTFCDQPHIQLNIKLKNIIIDAWHEKWAVWKETVDKIDEIKVHLKNLSEEIDQTMKHLENNEDEYYKHVLGNSLYHLLYYTATTHILEEPKTKLLFKKAIVSYKKIIKIAKNWSAFAHYNLAYWIIRNKEANYRIKAIKQLRKAKWKLKNYKTEVLSTRLFILMSHENNLCDQDIISPFLQHNYFRCVVLAHVEKNIDDNIEILRNEKQAADDNVEIRFYGDISSVILNSDCSSNCLTEALNDLRQMGLTHQFLLKSNFNVCTIANINEMLNISHLLVNFFCVLHKVGNACSNVEEAVAIILNEINNCVVDWQNWGVLDVIKLSLASLQSKRIHSNSLKSNEIAESFIELAGDIIVNPRISPHFDLSKPLLFEIYFECLTANFLHKIKYIIQDQVNLHLKDNKLCEEIGNLLRTNTSREWSPDSKFIDVICNIFYDTNILKNSTYTEFKSLINRNDNWVEFKNKDYIFFSEINNILNILMDHNYLNEINFVTLFDKVNDSELVNQGIKAIVLNFFKEFQSTNLKGKFSHVKEKLNNEQIFELFSNNLSKTLYENACLAIFNILVMRNTINTSTFNRIYKLRLLNRKLRYDLIKAEKQNSDFQKHTVTEEFVLLSKLAQKMNVDMDQMTIGKPFPMTTNLTDLFCKLFSAALQMDIIILGKPTAKRGSTLLYVKKVIISRNSVSRIFIVDYEKFENQIGHF